MIIEKTKLQDEINGGWINVQAHPTLPLSILKYAKPTVFSSRWNDITTICRGLVIDNDYNIILSSMIKFWNNNQAEVTPILERTKDLPYEVFDKLDGSLLQICKWNGHLVVTSSGSFDSPQVHKAKELLSTKYSHYNFEDGLSYIFEIIYKQNRIVLDYGDKESLTLLTIRKTESGEEIPYEDLVKHYSQFELVEKVDKTIEDILKELPREDWINREGYVVKFSNGDRVKYKLDRYIRLHKIISGISEKWVHECLSQGINPLESLVDVPDELLSFVTSTRDSLLKQYNEISLEANRLYALVKDVPTRKEQAALILKEYKPYANLIFSLLDGKVPDKAIWDRVEYKNSNEKNFVFGRGEA